MDKTSHTVPPLKQQTVNFGIIGSGWRSECYIQTARRLEAAGFQIKISGIVSRRAKTRNALTASYGIPAFAGADELVQKTAPDFLLVSVSGNAVYSVLLELIKLNIPLLTETPPATTLAELTDLYKKVQDRKACIQVAEQYWLQPMQQARLEVCRKGLIGKSAWAHVSVNHSFHNISLIRKYLNTGFENAHIQAFLFSKPLTEGPGRNGPPQAKRIINTEHMFAVLDFTDKQGIFDFQESQHRSWVRNSRVLVRGEQGEIADNKISWLKEFNLPVYGELNRIHTGGDSNFEDNYLCGVMAGEQWLYKNRTIPARLSDEEISQAECLLRMADYAKTGTPFYSLAEAAQDTYLAILLKESSTSGKPVESRSQIWAS